MNKMQFIGSGMKISRCPKVKVEAIAGDRF